jgi:hypothetical protein
MRIPSMHWQSRGGGGPGGSCLYGTDQERFVYFISCTIAQRFRMPILVMIHPFTNPQPPVSHKLQSSIGSSCPKSPTKIIEISPKICLPGGTLVSLKYALLPCWVRKCIFEKSALPMNEISSMMRRATFSHVSSSFRSATPSISGFHCALGNI